jgi:hypothetical protein
MRNRSRRCLVGLKLISVTKFESMICRKDAQTKGRAATPIVDDDKRLYKRYHSSKLFTTRIFPVYGLQKYVRKNH